MKKAIQKKTVLFTTRAIAVAAAAVILPACQSSPPADQGASPATATATASAAAKATVIQVTVGDDGFQPNHISLAKGQAATLRFTRTTDGTCAKKVVFPDISVEKDLPLNQPVDVEIPTTDARELAFQCGMGMYKSKVVVGGS